MNVFKLLFLLLAMTIATACAHDRALSNYYASLKRGDIETDVTGRFGQPARENAGGFATWDREMWGGPYERCAKTVAYTPWLNPFDEAYSICSDAQSRVIGKYHYMCQ